MFTRIIEFQKYDGSAARSGTDRLPIAAADDVRGAPALAGADAARIVHTPQLRADGSLVEASGYDPDTRLLFKFDGEVFPPVPAHPTKADADAALKVVEEAIATFPFKTDVDRSVVLSLFLTALLGAASTWRRCTRSRRRRQGPASRCWSALPRSWLAARPRR